MTTLFWCRGNLNLALSVASLQTMTDYTNIEMYNTPTPGVSIEAIGTEPRITHHVDWEQMNHPTPAMFNDVNTLEVKAAVLPGNIKDDELEDAAMDVLDAVQTLKSKMLEKRDLTEDQEQAVAMGNLNALPEVTDTETEQVPVDDA